MTLVLARRGPMLISYSEDVIVARGVKAIMIIYQLSSRVPLLIQQSHLERNEGQTASNSHLLNSVNSSKPGTRIGHPSSVPSVASVPTHVELSDIKHSRGYNVHFSLQSLLHLITKSGLQSSVKSSFH